MSELTARRSRAERPNISNGRVWSTSSSPVLVVTTSMSELLSSSVTVSSSSVGVAGLNWKGVLAPLISPA